MLATTGGWDVEQDLELPAEVLDTTGGAISEKASVETFTEPTPGRSPDSYWVDNSPLAVDHVLAGRLRSSLVVSSEEALFSCFFSRYHLTSF